MLETIHTYYTREQVSASEQIPHTIVYPTGQIPIAHPEWCRDHCRATWGWWFDDRQGYLGFKDPNEMMWFRMAEFEALAHG